MLTEDKTVATIENEFTYFKVFTTGTTKFSTTTKEILVSNEYRNTYLVVPSCQSACEFLRLSCLVQLLSLPNIPTGTM